MKEEKEKNIKKATNGRVWALIEKRKSRAKKKRDTKKLMISDIKHGEGAHVGHLLHRIKAREVELTFCCVTISLVIILISLYFVFSAVREPKKYNAMMVGNFYVSFNEIGESLGDIVDLTPIYPMSDIEGMKKEAYSVHIENTTNKIQYFQILLKKDLSMITEDECEERQLPYQYLRYQVEDYGISTLNETFDSVPVLFSSSLKPKEKKTYQIHIWVPEDLPIEYLDYHYHGRLVIKNKKTIK